MGTQTPVKKPRVVLDTNCVISALLVSGGRLAWLRKGWQRQRFIPLISRDTVDELIRVLNYPKFRLDQQDQRILLADYLPYTETVTIKSGRHDMPGLHDLDDAIFIALAIKARADALISGDARLLEYGHAGKKIPILPAPKFLKQLESRNL